MRKDCVVAAKFEALQPECYCGIGLALHCDRSERVEYIERATKQQRISAALFGATGDLNQSRMKRTTVDVQADWVGGVQFVSELGRIHHSPVDTV